MFISAVLSSLKVLRVRSPEEITNPRRISSSVHHIYSMENFRLRYLTSGKYTLALVDSELRLVEKREPNQDFFIH
jgi:hypothetical protein